MLNELDYDLLSSIIDCIYEAVCVIDEEGTVVIWNKSAEKLYNIMYDQIYGRNIKDFFPNAIVDLVRITGKAAENIQHIPRASSHILANSKPLLVRGKFMGAVSTDRDFEEVKKLYYDLENANNRLVFLENEVRRLEGTFGDIIGNNPVLLKKIEIARQIAPVDTSVMITGESGTGKEVFARGIHEASGRKGHFVPVNCSAIPGELFESEFFGYSPGAFTGASKKGKIGVLELANNGTIFLDEIGDLPFKMQAKLLRFLQDKTITKVGSEKSIKLDVRVISATNLNLKQMVQENKFREDLFYRLNVIELDIPPLRERKDDLPLLINYFLKLYSKKLSKKIRGIDKEAIDILMEYPWPGNIRELMNVLEQIVVINAGGYIGKKQLPSSILAGFERQSNFWHIKDHPLDLSVAVKELEEENIKRALLTSKNNKSKAARLLNIPRATLYHKMEEYKLFKRK
jgi:transcriptional regulator with PAS, ATPase and Fis domain